MPILWPLKVPESDTIVNYKTTAKHVCLYFIRSSTARTLRILFDTLQKIPTQIKLPKKKNTCQSFLPKKFPESKSSNLKKSFDHPRHLKSGVLPPGVLNTATPQKILTDIAPLQEKSTKHLHRNTYF